MLDEPFRGLDPLERDQLIEKILDLAAESTVFVSLHDLAEIENFASHVGYLDQGRLRFSEEMTSLTARFRGVEVAFNSPPSLPAKQPETWLQPQTSSNVVRFVASHFDSDRTVAEIREFLGEMRDVAVTPMTLRSIFLAIARTRRKS